MKLNKIKAMAFGLALVVSANVFASEKIGIIYGEKFDNKEIKNYVLKELKNNYSKDDISLVEVKRDISNQEKYESLSKRNDLKAIIYLDFLSQDKALKLNKKIVSAPFYYGMNPFKNIVTTTINYNRKYIVSLFKSLKIDENLVIVTTLEDTTLAKEESKKFSEILNKEVKVLTTEALKKINTNTISGIVFIGDSSKIKDSTVLEKIRSIPSFTYNLDVKNNSLGSLIGYDYEKEIDRRIRANLIALDKDLSQGLSKKSIELSSNDNIVLNQEVAKKFDKYLNKDEILNVDSVVPKTEKTKVDLSLKKGLEELLEKNIQIKVEEKKLESQKYQIDIAKSGIKPKIDLVGNYANIDKTRANMSPTIAQNTLTGGVKITQVLYNSNTMGNISLQNKAYTALELEKRNNDIKTILNYITSYFTVLKDDSTVRILEENKNIIKEYLKIARSKAESGFTGFADVYRFQSELASAESRLTDAKIRSDNSVLELNRVLNITNSNYYKLSDTGVENIIDTNTFYNFRDNLIKPWEIKEVRDQYIKSAIESSPLIKKLQGSQKVEEQRYKNISRSRYTPTIALNVNYNKDVKKPWGEGSSGVKKGEDWTIGVGFQIPLYEGGEISGYKNQTSNNIDRIKLQLEDTKKIIEKQVYTGFNNVLGALKKIELSKKSLEASKKNLDLQLNLYKGGTGNIVNVLDARNTFIEAKENNIETEIGFYTNLAKLESLKGVYYYELSK